jgi:GNAT superfamily N-acetyltransferase
MEIRSGSPSDAEAIARLIASFQSELTDDPSGAGAEAYLASVSVEAERQYLASARYRYLLAYAGSQLAGFIAIRDGSHLFHLFVERAHQRQGLARLLWEQALYELGAPRSQGAFTVKLKPFGCAGLPSFGLRSSGVNKERPWHLVSSHAAPRFISMRPNPSLYPTRYGWLRQPPRAAELKR